MKTLSRLCWHLHTMVCEIGNDQQLPSWARQLFCQLLMEPLYFGGMVFQGDWTTYWQDRAYERQLALSSEEQMAAASFA